MSHHDSVLPDDENVVDWTVEKIGNGLRKVAIRKLLHEEFPDVPNKKWLRIFEDIYSNALRKIQRLYKQDIYECLGEAIECARMVKRKSRKGKDILAANDQLIRLFGLDRISTTEAPEAYAEKVKKAIIAMNNSVDGIPQQEDKDSNEPQNISTQAEQEEEQLSQETTTELRIAAARKLKKELHKEDNPSPEKDNL